MENKRIFDKIEKIEEHIGSINVTLGKQEVTLFKQEESLTEHVKRTNILQNKISMAEGVLKFIGLLGVIATIVKAVMMFV